ncbi:MAG: glycosyltransferase family 4 protein [Chitinophagales bacterium]
MKVCHLTSVHPPYDTRIFVKECSSLAAAGFDVTLIAPAEKDEIRNGVKIVAVKKNTSRISRMITTVNEVWSEALKVNADIYHFHDPELIRIGLRLKQHGFKVIYDAHEDVPRQLMAKHYLPSFSRRLIASRFEQYENRAAEKFDQIVTVTPLLEKRFKRFNPNTVEVCNFPSLQEFPKAESNWHQRKNEICYIGNITAIRGIHEMVKAMEHCNSKLHLGGSFSPLSLREEVVHDNGWKKVVEHGFMNREQVKATLSSSKVGLVLLHPAENYTEAYPVKMFEYMAAGLPVIASDFPLWKEIISRHQCGICVDPADISAIADAINYLLSNDTIAQQMGLNGRQAIESEYNWEQEEKKLVAIYQLLKTEAESQ